jgi:RNA polymerase sigma-70 factor (sigma-E family)
MSHGSTRDREFGDYYAARGAAVRATAFLLCGDWHLAQDLAQTAFVRLYQVWPRIAKRDTIEHYVRRTLLRTFLDERRRPWRRERPSADLPDRGGPPPADGADDRMTLRRALAAVPPRQRAVLVLRYWEDLPVEEVADLLGVSAGTVKSQSARGLDTLRRLVSDSYVLAGEEQ